MWQDLRFAVRLLVRDRWFTAAAAAALALGIGMNAMVFTLVDALLVRSLPFEDPDRVMYVGERDTATGRVFMVSWPDFEDWRAAEHSFAGLGAWSAGTMNISDAEQPAERRSGAYFTANAFQLFGERPILGRDFAAADDRPDAAPVVILGEALWKSRYGADPAIAGRTMQVNGVAATIVGVMPARMKFPDADLWIPLSHLPGLGARRRDERFGVQAFGRLAPGVSRRQAQVELTGIAARLERDHPDTNRNIGAAVMTFNERLYGGPIRLAILSSMGAVGFVLLIACANVANLLLARSAGRAREIAIRAALGATRWRIVRQLLVESTLVAALGGALGWLIALWGTRWFDAATASLGRPYYLRFAIDAPVLAFFGCVCLGTAILFGLAPALHASRTEPGVPRYGGGDRRARRWASALVIGELALTLVLLAGAGLMMRSFLALYRPDAAIETAHLLTLNLMLPVESYPTAGARAAFFARLEQGLAGLPGVRGATLASSPPLAGGQSMRLSIDGRAQASPEAPEATRIAVGLSYFETVGLPLVRGRAFSAGDGAPGRDVAIVNQRFAAMYLAGRDPIGSRIALPSEGTAAGEPAWLTIVAVAPTVRQRNLREFEPDPVVYVPCRAVPTPAMTLLVRTDGEPTAVIKTVREQVRILDPDLPLFGVATLDETLAQSRSFYRIFGTMFSAFAVVALVLSAVGLYAMTAWSVIQRTREIGIRIALGADRRQVFWLVAGRAGVQLGIGLALGMAGALAVGRLLASLLARTAPFDVVTLAVVATVFAFVSVAACSGPMRRAAAIDPIGALRAE